MPSTNKVTERTTTVSNSRSNIMKAMAFDKTGKTKLTMVPIPTVQKNELLIKVKYSALDPSIESMMKRDFKSNFLHAKTNPLVLGWHFVGKVVQIGQQQQQQSSSSKEKQTKFSIDDMVWGHLQYEPSQRQGAFAEYITVEVSACSKIPDQVSFPTLAAAATETMTALQALCNNAGLDKENIENNHNKSVLILGAGGGVGSAAVAIAKCLGVDNITAVCSTKDMDRVKALGATKLIDRKKQGQERSIYVSQENWYGLRCYS